MSARFVANFLVLLLGAATLIFLYAFGHPLIDWVALATGSACVVLAMYSFASVDQGVYQRIADLFIALAGAWAIVAARVMSYQGPWFLFGAGIAMLGLGAIGLLVREVRLAGGLQVGGSRIGPDQIAQIAVLQREAEAHRS